MELAALAAEAYVYGYPLVRDLSVVEGFMHTGFGPLPPAPFNHFAHAGRSAPPGAPLVSVDDDTVRSLAHLDLSGGPVLLHVPGADGADGAGGAGGADGAYCVLQFVDAWTNNFAYVGRRATGTRAGEWLVVPPGWAGDVPDGVLGVIDAPTSVVSVIGRDASGATDDSEDPERGRALRARLGVRYVEPGTHRTGLPAPDPDVPESLRFFEQLRVWMADFPPSAPDQAYQDRFQPLGLLEEGPSPYTRADPALVRALTEGLARGRAWVEEAGRAAAGRGGWVMDPHLFDYNLDHYGVGTIDSPEWRIADREASYRTRAVAARCSLWGVHGYEAVYAHTFRDAGGERLNGAGSYVLRFDGRPPPVEASWSLAVYDATGQRPVETPGTRRRPVGDRTPGLVHGEDGSLTVHLRRERPEDPVAAANWLPVPDGDFRLVLRLWAPGPEILDGTYEIPAVERIR
ncbi:DUF1254 domain-containing protein [Streptomyces sp. NBC_01363]|uniref:DUF1254 domain-containing protein n=1 Tax=Streptomyces sp. NBC_01363 TaxID=2903840 RepID=UPI00225A570B|nr:DUF1254 domain-containing protein [Streptomyces sp. NBC_01363]MCX4732294.1 DUF1254 domain-containing protein [Streptomyces sp. NBC_01363]